jgi:hypothetical protein
MSRQPNATAGTMTAKSVDEPDFVADSRFEISRLPNHWQISAADASEQGNRALYIHVPASLPDTGIEKTYPLNGNDGAENAWIRYISGDFMVSSSTGSLTLRYYGDQEKMVGTFDFEGGFGGKRFRLTDGHFEMTGLKEPGVHTTNSLTADVTGAFPVTYSTQTHQVAFLPDTQQLELYASELIWSTLPPRVHALILRLPEGTKKGSYKIGKFGDPIYASYNVLAADGNLFPSIEGDIELLADASVDHLEANLRFTAIAAGAPDKTMQIADGKVIYKRIPAK